MNAATAVNKSMETSMERLSTGKRINAASDDAAGVAISSRLSAEIKGTNQSIRNAMDAQALIDTAEGAHLEVVNLLQRMREVAVQSANDTNDTADRTNLKAEMDQMVNEINRIALTTTWAGKQLLDGATGGANLAALATSHTDVATFDFHVGSGTLDGDKIRVTVGATSAKALGVGNNTEKPSALTETADDDTLITVNQTNGTIVVDATTSGKQAKFKIEGTEITLNTSATDKYEVSKVGIANQIKDLIDAQNLGFNVAFDGTDKLTLTKGGAIAIDNYANSVTAIGTIDTAIATVNTQRANLGSFSNRLDSTVNNLTNISANLQTSQGRIEDADFAAESSNLAKQQILQQAATSMLAQANASKQSVLSLLQG
jgi:flagellin